MRFKPLAERAQDAALADPGFTRQQHHLAFAILRLRPPAKQQVQFLLPADQWCKPLIVQRVEPALDGGFADDLEGAARPDRPLFRQRRQLLVFEHPSSEPLTPL